MESPRSAAEGGALSNTERFVGGAERFDSDDAHHQAGRSAVLVPPHQRVHDDVGCPVPRLARSRRFPCRDRPGRPRFRLRAIRPDRARRSVDETASGRLLPIPRRATCKHIPERRRPQHQSDGSLLCRVTRRRRQAGQQRPFLRRSHAPHPTGDKRALELAMSVDGEYRMTCVSSWVMMRSPTRWCRVSLSTASNAAGTRNQ